MSTTDYLVIGGGSAGCVLARRLSDDPAVRVTLVEAGPADGGAAVRDPAHWTELIGGPLDWGHAYEPAAPTLHRHIPIPRGRVLGGSSAINAMLWYRGHPADYDAWGAGWDFATLLPYFRRSEDRVLAGASLAEVDEWRGTGGPMHVEREAEPHPVALAVLDAAAELGLPLIADANGATNLGATVPEYTARFGGPRAEGRELDRRARRHSAADGYLAPVADRPNLRIRCGALVTGLEFAGGRCVGARYRVAGGTAGESVVRAEREVILCLGALETPRLLMLAGIGPADHLRDNGIAVRADLPVGDRLADHPLVTGMTFRARAPLGPVRGTGGGAMVNWCGPESERPDLHAFVVQGPHATPEVAARFRLDPPVFAVSPGLMRSRSLGTVRLTSADPTAHLRIQPNLLGEPEDVRALCAAVELVQELGESRALRAVAAGPAAPDRRLDAGEREAFVRLATSTFFHVAGTAAIGSVVDRELRVHGVEGLRVVDASVFPSLPSCNTNAPVIAVAERAADLVKESV